MYQLKANEVHLLRLTYIYILWALSLALPHCAYRPFHIMNTTWSGKTPSSESHTVVPQDYALGNNIAIQTVLYTTENVGSDVEVGSWPYSIYPIEHTRQMRVHTAENPP